MSADWFFFERRDMIRYNISNAGPTVLAVKLAVNGADRASRIRSEQ
jgi:hypothetical protein